MLRRIQQPQQGTPAGEPLLFSKSALGSFTCVTQHMGPTALRPIRRMKQWLSVLLKDTSVMAGNLNQHSADQKHQNSVLLTARPRHLQSVITRLPGVAKWPLYNRNIAKQRQIKQKCDCVIPLKYHASFFMFSASTHCFIWNFYRWLLLYLHWQFCLQSAIRLTK